MTAQAPPADTDRAPRGDQTPNSAIFWGATLLGGALMAFGAYGLTSPRGPGIGEINLRTWLLWFVGPILLHDGLVAPLTLLVGRGIRRVRPVLLRTPLQVGLALTAIVTLLAFPLLRGYGRASQPGNASVLPGDYVPAWLGVLALIWIGAAVVAVAARRRDRRSD